MKIARRRRRQVFGMAIGLFLSVTIYTVLLMPGNEHMVVRGPMNTGHSNLQCQDCHVKARGNVFQQLHANTMHALGYRKKGVDFGHQDVDNHQCLACHDRPNDRHPVHRFREPRFASARKAIQPTKCESCHLEHQGKRVTIASNYCVNCHKETKLKEDPLEVSHESLIKSALWTTCLQCHDFHGNHITEPILSIKDTIPLDVIKAYFDGSSSPFSDKKKYLAKKNLPGGKISR